MTTHSIDNRRVSQIVWSLGLTFAILRIFLHSFPNQDLDVGGYNVHHLFTGLLLVLLGGIPVAVFHGRAVWLDLATVGFGVGLAMALDEWLYLIVTDGSNASYLLPVSFWGGLGFVSFAGTYAFAMRWVATRTGAAARAGASAGGGRTAADRG